MLNNAKLFSLLWMFTGIFSLLFSNQDRGLIMVGFGILFHMMYDLGKILKEEK